ncbi:MAG: GTPase ObgE, partial [Acutalibacteraceae bacterium]|nr:GTPase ObgE [Acutalibacteraceae bacterium]
NLSTLADFRYKRKYVANDGAKGGTRRCTGKSAENLVISVPRGTLVKDAESGRLIADISTDEPVVIAKGGNGGWGNMHFSSATRQIPKFSKPGNPGEAIDVTLELKLLADVGLIGFPNVGKSTLVSVVSEAKPKIANYHFTTLTPVLGVVRMGEGSSFVMADIPGLIEGAGEGVGLGHEFLRHVERCRLLLHVLDVSGSEGRDPIDDFNTINNELKTFSEELAERPQIIVGNKCDLTDEGRVNEIKAWFEERGYAFFPIMAPISEGTDELINFVAAELAKLPDIKIYEPDPIPVEELLPETNRRTFTVDVVDGVYIVDNAPWLLKILETVNPEDYESLQYFQRTLQQSGIIQALVNAGVEDGDIVSVYDIEFEFVS